VSRSIIDNACPDGWPQLAVDARTAFAKIRQLSEVKPTA